MSVTNLNTYRQSKEKAEKALNVSGTIDIHPDLKRRLSGPHKTRGFLWKILTGGQNKSDLPVVFETPKELRHVIVSVVEEPLILAQSRANKAVLEKPDVQYINAGELVVLSLKSRNEQHREIGKGTLHNSANLHLVN